MPVECNNFQNNPATLTLENKLGLFEENRRGCYDDGFRDGRATSYDKDRSSGCSEYNGSYRTGFSAGCRSANNTYDTCQILIEGYEVFCPLHPESKLCRILRQCKSV
jgi:hypothetical protein